MVERVVLNALGSLRLCRLMSAPSTISPASSSEKPIHLCPSTQGNAVETVAPLPPDFRF